MSVSTRLTRLLPALACAAAVPSLLLAQAASQHAAGGQPVRELPVKYTGPATRPAITAGDLMTRLYIYADDSMMGRDAFSPFHARATSWIESEVRRLGLEPAGDSGTFFQHPLVLRATDSTTSTVSIDGTAYRLWRDFAPRDQGLAARSYDGMPVVYGGSLGDTAHFIPRGSEAGKIVLVTLAGTPGGARAWQSVNRGLLTARFAEAAAIAVAQLDYTPPTYNEIVYAATQPGVRGTALNRTVPSYFYVTDAVARAMLGANPDSAAPGATGRTVRGSIRFNETDAPGRNVVAILRGSDPVLRNQYVAIGAHSDHVGYSTVGQHAPVQHPLDHDSVRAFHLVVATSGAEWRPRPLTAEETARVRAVTDSLHALHGLRLDSIFNGADDDGSGSVSVLEIAEQFARARVRPKRSLLFIWHVGEEYGMLGSGYFTDHPTVPRDSIVAELNIDMIGRGGAQDETGVTKDGATIHGGPGYVQLIGSRRLSTELGDLTETVNRERRFGLQFDYSLDANAHPQNIYCRSDHASYARYGIPVVFFTTGGHADYHQLTDEPQYIDYNRMEKVATMVAALAERVANLDHRVVVDHPRPDPNGNCQQ